jgi:demethoxyubiquinone hydroxylase (CLK1/Coq7/Cat5 family)
MRADEMEHGAKAIAAGAAELPAFVPGMMRLTAKVMTGVAYWI